MRRNLRTIGRTVLAALLATGAVLGGLLPAPAHTHAPGERELPVYERSGGCIEGTSAAPHLLAAERVAGTPCPACAAGPAPAPSLPAHAEAVLVAPSTSAGLARPDAPPLGAHHPLALVRGPPPALPS